VRAPPYVPAPGDLVWLSFASQVGHEHAAQRPAVIVSPAEYNRKVGLCLCCPVTRRVKGYPFELELPQGLEVTGAVLCDQVKSVDWKARNARRIASLPAVTVREVQARILVLIQ